MRFTLRYPGAVRGRGRAHCWVSPWACLYPSTRLLLHPRVVCIPCPSCWLDPDRAMSLSKGLPSRTVMLLRHGNGLGSDITSLLGFFRGFTGWKSPDSCFQPLKPKLGAATQLSRLIRQAGFWCRHSTAREAVQDTVVGAGTVTHSQTGDSGRTCRQELILLEPPRRRDGFQGVGQSMMKAEEVSVFLACRWPPWPTGIKPVPSFAPSDPLF